MITPGLITDDQAIIAEELKTLNGLLSQLDEQIQADRSTLRMVESAEHVLDMVPADEGKHMVLFSSNSTGLVVDRAWAGLS